MSVPRRSRCHKRHVSNPTKATERRPPFQVRAQRRLAVGLAAMRRAVQPTTLGSRLADRQGEHARRRMAKGRAPRVLPDARELKTWPSSRGHGRRPAKSTARAHVDVPAAGRQRITGSPRMRQSSGSHRPARAHPPPRGIGHHGHWPPDSHEPPTTRQLPRRRRRRSRHRVAPRSEALRAPWTERLLTV